MNHQLYVQRHEHLSINTYLSEILPRNPETKIQNKEIRNIHVNKDLNTVEGVELSHVSGVKRMHMPSLNNYQHNMIHDMKKKKK